MPTVVGVALSWGGDWCWAIRGQRENQERKEKDLRANAIRSDIPTETVQRAQTTWDLCQLQPESKNQIALLSVLLSEDKEMADDATPPVLP